METTTLCPETSLHLVGEHLVDTSLINLTTVETLLPEVHHGGAWRPEHCLARHRVAILIPYRDREQHLGIFLKHMHPFLQRQLLDYRIFVVEQSGDAKFNRGMLFNIGFKHVEEMTSGYYQCYVLSDVDLLPENDLAQYSCTYNVPRHLSFLLSKYNYQSVYDRYVGGVIEISKDHFRKINGFSNLFFGWGAEDDDLYHRMKVALPRPHYQRYNKTLSRYFMLGHSQSPRNPERRRYLSHFSAKRMSIDGLTTLGDVYKLLQIDEKKLFTNILVNIDKKVTISEYHQRAAIFFNGTDLSLRYN